MVQSSVRAALLLAAAIAVWSGCRVCVGGCKQVHGRVVTKVAPAADGSLTVTSCFMTTKGGRATFDRCRAEQLKPPPPRSPQ
jgi:hypothetical protein